MKQAKTREQYSTIVKALKVKVIALKQELAGLAAAGQGPPLPKTTAELRKLVKRLS